MGKTLFILFLVAAVVFAYQTLRHWRRRPKPLQEHRPHSPTVGYAPEEIAASQIAGLEARYRWEHH